MNETVKYIVTFWFDGLKGPVETTHEFDKDYRPDDALELVKQMIPDRGSKWLIIGDVLFNTFNVRAVTVR